MRIERDGWTIIADEEDGYIYAVSGATGEEYALERGYIRRNCIAHGAEAQEMLEGGAEDVHFYDNSGDGCGLGTLHAYKKERAWVMLDNADELLNAEVDTLIDAGLITREAAWDALVNAAIDEGSIRVHNAVHDLPGASPLGAVVA